jgi:L-fucose mutarotase
MLTTGLIHPEILAALGSAGHGSQVLIADGNYPFSTGTNPAAARVYLNLSPGVVSATDVLAAVGTAIPIEAARVMVPDDGLEPAIFAEFRTLLGNGHDLEPMRRFDFYDAARGPDVALVIATAERRVYANLLLTIGVRPPEH